MSSPIGLINAAAVNYEARIPRAEAAELNLRSPQGVDRVLGIVGLTHTFCTETVSVDNGQHGVFNANYMDPDGGVGIEEQIAVSIQEPGRVARALGSLAARIGDMVGSERLTAQREPRTRITASIAPRGSFVHMLRASL